MEEETRTLESKTSEIVHWLNLENVPTAASLDPDNKMGLAGAFRKVDGVYSDPIPREVLEKAKKNLIKNEIFLLGGLMRTKVELTTHSGTIEVPTGHKQFPLFRERVYSVAQYLAKLGFEPKPKTESESFVLGGMEKPQIYPTKDSMVWVKIERGGPNENSPVTRIKLVINP